MQPHMTAIDSHSPDLQTLAWLVKTILNNMERRPVRLRQLNIFLLVIKNERT